VSNAVIESCATNLRVSPGALSDTRQVQSGFTNFQRTVQENMQRGMTKSDAVMNTPDMITSAAAEGGAKDKTRATEVNKMIKCVGDGTGLNPGVTEQLQGMYGDAVSAQRFKQDPSITNAVRGLFGR
jgi:hypothetical protein